MSLVYLTVPFPEKDAAKQLGARWDGAARAWYIPEGIDTEPFSRWLPKTVSQSAPIMVVTATIAEKGISLSALVQQANAVMRTAFPTSIWVKAELTELNNRSGHWYLTLAESVSGQQVAQVRASIWANQAPRILAQFESVTGQTLQVGCALLLAVEISIHARFGLSLTVVDIDPSFTLGDQEAKLQAMRAQLQANGLYGRNRQQPFPADLCRIAVLSPAQAAGLGDFQADARLLAELGLCQFDYFYASFQGQQTQVEMLAALANIDKAHQLRAFDVLVVIRGGGAKQDLMFLNDVQIATQLCRFPIPVLTGIGHERDNTILDEVAHTRFDTPSKVIAFIREQIVQGAQQANQHWQRIQQAALWTVEQQRELVARQGITIRHQVYRGVSQQQLSLQGLQQQVAQAAQRTCAAQATQLTAYQQQTSLFAQHHIRQAKQQLAALQTGLYPNAQAKLQREGQQLNQLQQVVSSHHPDHILGLGYMIARDPNGQLLTRCAQAQQQPYLKLQFKDGSMRVRPDPDNPMMQEALFE
jgi:exodeoxyribonuclease VII large subunit